MANFQYTALTTEGVMTEGSVEASGRQEALRQLEGRGLSPLGLQEGRGHKPKANEGGFNLFESKKVTSKQLENFTRLLSSLLAAGLPLSRALVILCKEASSPAAKAKWKEVHDLVIDGVSLADAMARSPETFPKVYTAMVHAGETGGFLDVVLAQIADFQNREKELKGKVMTAMLYPIILLVIALLVLAGMLIWFIPRFETMFDGLGGELPVITQIVMGVSDMITNYGLFVLIGIGGIFAALKSWLSSEQGRRQWQEVLLKAPVLGALVSKFAMARFTRMLGTLLGAGVPLIDSLKVARRSIGNQVLVDAVENSTDQVKKGGSIGPSLANCRDLFPGSVVEMISVAEESGRLDIELVRIADVTEGDLDRQLKTAVALTEPLMLFFIASFIGTIFIALLLPIFSIQDHIK